MLAGELQAGELGHALGPARGQEHQLVLELYRVARLDRGAGDPLAVDPQRTAPDRLDHQGIPQGVAARHQVELHPGHPQAVERPGERRAAGPLLQEPRARQPVLGARAAPAEDLLAVDQRDLPGAAGLLPRPRQHERRQLAHRPAGAGAVLAHPVDGGTVGSHQPGCL